MRDSTYVFLGYAIRPAWISISFEWTNKSHADRYSAETATVLKNEKGPRKEGLFVIVVAGACFALFRKAGHVSA